MKNKIRKYAVVVGLASILTMSGEAEAGIFKGSIVDRLFISGPKEKKAEKTLDSYASDGYLTPSEKSQVLKIIDNKKVRKEIYATETRLKAEQERKRREAEARRKALARQSYRSAVDAKKHDDYYSAKRHINKALENSPNQIGYKIYSDYLDGSKKAKEDFREAKEEIKEGLRRTGSWLDDKIYTIKRKLRR